MHNKDSGFVIGVDFGTDSVRSLIVNAVSGEEKAVAESRYQRWSEGMYCNAQENRFRQHPLDYLESLEASLQDALTQLSANEKRQVRGLCVDTTGSTPCAVDATGTPLALLPAFADDPAAMFYLWKDHTATNEAGEITALCKSWSGTDFSQYSGGLYSPEWFWSKLLYLLRTSPDIARATYSWVEHCDWMTAVLVGNSDPRQWRRSRCAAGHKAMWHQSWGGLPSDDFLMHLHPELPRVSAGLFSETYTSDSVAGTLCQPWADKLGLSQEVVVAVGLLDAHAGAVGGGVRPGALLKVVGTSTCDMVVAPPEAVTYAVPGIAGQVDGSILPGMLGFEAGQSAFGDIYAWFKEILLWPLKRDQESDLGQLALVEELDGSLIQILADEAQKLPDHPVTAVDWWNGRRTPYVNMSLKGAISGLSLGTTAPALFKGIVESTVFGSQRIIEQFNTHGVAIDEVIAVGGVAKKSPFVMQTMADAFDKPVQVAESDQACALGSAIFAATAAGFYADAREAQTNLASKIQTAYQPDAQRVALLIHAYQEYQNLAQAIDKDASA